MRECKASEAKGASRMSPHPFLPPLFLFLASTHPFSSITSGHSQIVIQVRYGNQRDRPQRRLSCSDGVRRPHHVSLQRCAVTRRETRPVSGTRISSRLPARFRCRWKLAHPTSHLERLRSAPSTHYPAPRPHEVMRTLPSRQDDPLYSVDFPARSRFTRRV